MGANFLAPIFLLNHLRLTMESRQVYFLQRQFFNFNGRENVGRVGEILEVSNQDADNFISHGIALEVDSVKAEGQKTNGDAIKIKNSPVDDSRNSGGSKRISSSGRKPGRQPNPSNDKSRNKKTRRTNRP